MKPLLTYFMSLTLICLSSTQISVSSSPSIGNNRKTLHGRPFDVEKFEIYDYFDQKPIENVRRAMSEIRTTTTKTATIKRLNSKSTVKNRQFSRSSKFKASTFFYEHWQTFENTLPPDDLLYNFTTSNTPRTTTSFLWRAISPTLSVSLWVRLILYATSVFLIIHAIETCVNAFRVKQQQEHRVVKAAAEKIAEIELIEEYEANERERG